MTTRPTRHPTWEFYCGDTWPITFACRNSDGTVMPLTNDVQIIWKLANSLKTTDVITLTRGDGISVTDINGGVCLVLISADRSATLIPGRFYDELTIIKGGTFTMAEGAIVAKKKLP